jgi:hypothetical protein
MLEVLAVSRRQKCLMLDTAADTAGNLSQFPMANLH